MTTKPETTPADRLCSACGICCNGVLFQTVTLQPRDSASILSAHGFKLKRRKGGRFFQQPCPAFCGSHCSIYDDRPERCRLFECRQLKSVAAGEITEAAALEKIGEAKRRVAEMERLLKLAGDANKKRSLVKRFQKVTAEPVNETSAPNVVRLREELVRAERDLNTILDNDFRVDNN